MSKVTLLLSSLLVCLGSGCDDPNGLCVDAEDCTSIMSDQVILDEDSSVQADTSVPRFFELAARARISYSVTRKSNTDTSLDVGIFTNSEWNEFISSGGKSGSKLTKVETSYRTDPVTMEAFDNKNGQIQWVFGVVCKKLPTGPMSQPCVAHVKLNAHYDVIVPKVAK